MDRDIIALHSPTGKTETYKYSKHENGHIIVHMDGGNDVTSRDIAKYNP